MAFRFALLLAVVAGCSGDVSVPCSVAADCASGVCQPSGICAALGDTGAGDVPESEFESESETESESESETETASVTCLPNHDGRITRAEVPIAPELQATYLIAADAAFDTRGTPEGDPRWDLAQAFAGDTKVLVTTLDPATMWFGTSFPTATYATRLGADGDLLGVFRASDDGLYLQGVVSETDGLMRTELTYTPPAKLLAYPLEANLSWTSTSTVTGLSSGLATLATETYRGAVDARGVVATPFADFDALRVIVNLDRWVAGAYYTELSHVFVTECFGTIAALRSTAYATGPEFTTAVELRRLSP